MAHRHIHPTVIIASDHAGYPLKEKLKDFLLSLDYPIEDKGTFSVASVDYPDFIIPAAKVVAASKGKKFGIVLGGSGVGECIVANKVRGVRAVLVYDPYTARMSRDHNNANVICFGGRTITKDPEYAKRLLRIFLETKFSGAQRHIRRIKKISQYESRKR